MPLKKHFEQPFYQIYLTLESLLIKAVNNEGFLKEPLLGTEFCNTNIVLAHLNFSFRNKLKTS